jgi:hypothetical protein
MEEDERAELLGRLPERPELGLLEGAAVDVIVDLHALEAELGHAALHLLDGGVHLLHRHRAQAGEPLRPPPHHRGDLVVGGLRRGHRDLRRQVVVVEAHVGRDHLHLDAERVHVGETLFRGPPGTRRERLAAAAHDRPVLSPLVLLAPDGVPVAAVFGGLPEALGSQVGVDVDAAHEASSVGDRGGRVSSSAS